MLPLGIRAARSLTWQILSVSSRFPRASTKILGIWGAQIKGFCINDKDHQITRNERYFWGREREVERLTQMLRGTPQLSFVLGPPDSGISTLIKHVLNQSFGDRNTLHLNLRGHFFTSVDQLSSTLCKKLTLWAHFSPQKPPELGEMISQLTHTPSKSGDRPVLFIDHAHRLLDTGFKNPDRLDHLFSCLHEAAKKRCFHTILGSSDSLFLHRLFGVIRHTHLHPMEIGHLSKDDAQRFWNERVVVEIKAAGNYSDLPQFTDAYKVCGGSLSLLEKYGFQCTLNGGPIEPGQFEILGAEHNKLLNAWHGTSSASSSFIGTVVQPTWTRDQLMVMMTDLTQSPDGFIAYDKLCADVGIDVVHAFVNYGLLHLRSGNCLTDDLLNRPNGPLLTAASPAVFYAMKQFLAKAG